MDLKFSEILAQNDCLQTKVSGADYKIAVLSNITVSFLKPLLEYTLRKENVKAEVVIGNYDNIVQDASNYAFCNAVVIFWELCNISSGFPNKLELIGDYENEQLIEKVKAEIDITLNGLKNTPIVFFNRFNTSVFNGANLRKNRLDLMAEELNRYIENKSMLNLVLIDLDKIFNTISVGNSVDMRFYYSSKSLYTVDFFKAYTVYLKPIIMSILGKAKKALIFDCDNTLWKGILGEDGFNGIEMSIDSKNGMYFAEVQYIALELAKKGIIIGLCSKNNPEDVDEIINNHPDMLLRDKDIVIRKVNWNDKVQNIREIAGDLNIAVESIVFIDDSDFEINLVREGIPGISTFQVPTRSYEYPQMMRNVSRLFYNITVSDEDMLRKEMYKQQVKRDQLRSSYENIEDYLRTLELKINIYINDISLRARAAQMTQKTNQFNLTTRRYTETEIGNYIASNDADVIVFDVTDKYGEYGITGMCITKINKEKRYAEIDSLLMSCRVLGRNIESVFLNEVLRSLKEKNMVQVVAQYIETKKNQQVAEFYDQKGFSILSDNYGIKDYVLDLDKYQEGIGINYIKINYGRKS
jgi:FkbH-like protein